MKYMMILWLFMPNGAIIPGTYQTITHRYDSYEECESKMESYTKGISFNDSFVSPNDGFTYKVAGMGAMCVKDGDPNVFEDDGGQDPDITVDMEEEWEEVE